MFGVPSLSPVPTFPLSCLETTDSALRARSGLARYAVVRSVGRGGKPALSRRCSFSSHGSALGDLPSRAARAVSSGHGNPGLALTAPPHPLPPRLSFLLRQPPLSAAPTSRLQAAATGPANQTPSFPAGADQSSASVCWKRETLRGKAITKAFHCRQMLSVCADFSCF